MIHTILLTRIGDARVNAVLTLSSDAVSAETAFTKFHRACHRWLVSTQEGAEFEQETMGDFNIGDLLCNDATILNDDNFQSILQEEGVEIRKVETADFHVPYDRILCNPTEA